MRCETFDEVFSWAKCFNALLDNEAIDKKFGAWLNHFLFLSYLGFNISLYI